MQISGENSSEECRSLHPLMTNLSTLSGPQPHLSTIEVKSEKKRNKGCLIFLLWSSLWGKKTFERLTGTIFLRYRDCTAVSVCLSVSLSFCLSPNASGMHPLSSSSLDSPSDVERSQEVNPCVQINVFLPKYVDTPLTHMGLCLSSKMHLVGICCLSEPLIFAV